MSSKLLILFRSLQDVLLLAATSISFVPLYVFSSLRPLGTSELTGLFAKSLCYVGFLVIHQFSKQLEFVVLLDRIVWTPTEFPKVSIFCCFSKGHTQVTCLFVFFFYRLNMNTY